MTKPPKDPETQAAQFVAKLDVMRKEKPEVFALVIFKMQEQGMIAHQRMGLA